METWKSVDSYLCDALLEQDSILNEILAASDAAELPKIAVAPNQGKLLNLLAQITDAKRILEVGTLGGYSTVWLARALPADGKLVTLEFDPKHAEVAKQNIEVAGFAHQVSIIIGDAGQTLPALYAEDSTPFDFIFIDADKAGYPTYYEWAVKFSRPGTVIICDNVVRDGAVIDPTTEDVNVKGVQKVLAQIGADPRVTASAVQTVGSKGYDGFAMVVVKHL